MNKFNVIQYPVLLIVIRILSSLCDAEVSTTPSQGFEIVQLTETELLYLNERLQTKEHMSLDDTLNTLVELEHFYTLCKEKRDEGYSPSLMVDKAWHQHILHTEMYGEFSRKHFGLDILHHLPYWSGNIEAFVNNSDSNEENGAIKTYNALVAMFGPTNVNATVWLYDDEEPIDLTSRINKHSEL